MPSLKKLLASAAVLMGLATLPAYADYAFTGVTDVSGGFGTGAFFAGQAAEAYSFNADGGTLFGTGAKNNWGSPGVGNGNTHYLEAQATYGLIVSFTGVIAITALRFPAGMVNVAGTVISLVAPLTLIVAVMAAALGRSSTTVNISGDGEPSLTAAVLTANWRTGVGSSSITVTAVVVDAPTWPPSTLVNVTVPT